MFLESGIWWPSELITQASYDSPCLTYTNARDVFKHEHALDRNKTDGFERKDREGQTKGGDDGG